MTLRDLDAEIARSPQGGLTLDPARPGQRATPLVALLERARPEIPEEAGFERFGAGLARVARAQLDAFPGNIFWDFDRLAWVLTRDANADGAAFMRRIERLAEIMTLFGGTSPIRFQYVHDFMYGFDWSAWVRRDPEHRADVDPFDVRYVERTHRRGTELLELIAGGDDEEYPPVRANEFRNPFGFDRTPAEERALFERLASVGGIPNPAWNPTATPRWDTDFYAIRARVADELAGRSGVG